MSATKAEIAGWMIEARFGPEWVYENENGNPAINRAVLTEFRKQKPDEITWDNRDKSWSL